MRNVTAVSVLRVVLLTAAALLVSGNVCIRSQNPHSPRIPSKPRGPTLVIVDDMASYATFAKDPDRNKVIYVFDWGDGIADTTDYFEDGDTGTASHVWESLGTHVLRTRAQDEFGKWSYDWSDTLVVTVDAYVPPNHPPDAPARPTHTGIDSVLKPIAFSASATDPDGDSVRIRFFFQGGETPTYGPRVASGAVFTDTAVYVTNGWKAIYAVAQDTWGDTSVLSAPDSIFINSPPLPHLPRP